MLVADKEILTVGIIDDDPDARQNYMWTLEDAHFFPAQESGPLNDLKTCVDSLFKRVDAVLCDHHLR
ncbi:MAG: hypothetical protein QG608_40, partial [Actinomycetota bacterium]|nr:hypothetical protein [Actinomycetota bacterium]